MTYKVDFVDGQPLGWKLTDDGAEPYTNDEYNPSIYVGVRDGNQGAVKELKGALETDPKVEALSWEEWYTELGSEEREPVLRIDLERVDEIDTLAREIRNHHEWGSYAPGTFELYNVDFSPQFRYCLETRTDPAPSRPLEPLELSLSEKALADEDITRLRMDGESIDESPEDVLATVEARVAKTDPDLLVLNRSQVVPALYDCAERLGLDELQLGRLPGFQQLAGESTFESYGRVGHSSARYNIPGRAIIDNSNSFMLGHAGMQGVLDLVERSWKPIQETGWASIGNLLTAIQIREALDRGILIPWNKSDPEQFKRVETSHDADRGGFTFDPDVGMHEEVYELDFSSLYPNIMIEYNVSPETVRCACHRGRADVPELGYSICDERGFIPDVLEPIVNDRDRIKKAIRETDDPDVLDALEERSDALKWILVTCFGYQGYKNSKFGRIEAHEAINAYARDILLQAKEVFESNGWRIVHGIVDSIWVAPIEDEEQAPLMDLAEQISDLVDIRLEFEREYDWICFVPMRNSEAGALTKYFGKVTGEDEYKYRGIEVRQRSTPKFVEECQRRYIETLGEYRDPEAVVDRLSRDLQRLRSDEVAPEDLLIRNRTSKPVDEYSQRTLTLSALYRYRQHGIDKAPGQDVTYVVTDDDTRLQDRVILPFEDIEQIDFEFYEAKLIRACESIISPLGWQREGIARHLSGTRDAKLVGFGF